jgi:hypothetical protein
MHTDQPAELLTASDAARVLVMSVDNVRRLTRTGVLKAAAREGRPLAAGASDHGS